MHKVKKRKKTAKQRKKGSRGSSVVDKRKSVNSKAPKKKVGRPKNEYTKTQIDEIADYAFHGCQTKTIETLTGIPETNLRRDFGDLLRKKRAERKLHIRKAQDKELDKGNPALLIFIGKNELDQADKKDHNITGNITFVTQNYGSGRRKKNSSTG